MPTVKAEKDTLPVDPVKIKQEKVTPPPTPQKESAAELSVTNSLLDNILNERKPIAEPIKSSDEFLADLFKVFNAAPPTLDDDNTNDSIKEKKHKKHKKEKKVKKEKKEKKAKKKRSRTNSDENSDDSGKSKSHKAKKAKKTDSDGDNKSHKRDKKPKEVDIKTEKIEVVIKREKNDDAKKTSVRNESGSGSLDSVVSTKKSRPNEDKNPPMNIQVCLTKDNDGAISKRKIVIKSLVDSSVYQDTLKEVDAKQKEKEKEREKLKEREKAKERTRDREKRKHTKHRSKSKDKERRGRSRSSSLSLSDEETYLREKEQEHDHRHKDRDRDRERDLHKSKDEGGRERDRDRIYDRERERDRDTYKDKERDDFYGDYRHDIDKDFERRRHRSRNDFYRHDHDRRRSRSTSRHRRERTEDRIDKKRLLEIARKNAITMLKNGTLPGTHNLDPEAKERALTKMRYGGKSVDELTEFCKKLSKGEASGYLSNISGDSDVDADLEKPFHHPFVIKDRGPIVMNIKNATPIPPKTAEQTKAILMQFPVSSGQHHRLNESEWVPVEPQKPAKEDKKVTEKPMESSKVPTVVSKQQTSNDIPLPTTDYGYQTTPFIPQPEASSSFATTAPVIEPVPPPSIPQPAMAPLTDNIFADKTTGKDLDVTSIITKRLNAMRKLQDNPMDSEAIKLMYRTQKDMSAWASSKFVPGQFTGSTGASILSTKELCSGFQAWAKRIISKQIFI